MTRENGEFPLIPGVMDRISNLLGQGLENEKARVHVEYLSSVGCRKCWAGFYLPW